jgi:hypothetical protein
MLIEARQEGANAQDPSEWLMAPWTFNIKFPYDTQFISGSLMFVVGEDGNLELLTQGPGLKHPELVYGQAPYYMVDPSTSGGARSGLNPYAGLYYLSAMTSRGLPIGAPIFQPSAGTASSSSSGASFDQDSTEDYPEISGSSYWNLAVEGHHISMVAPAGAPSQNSSSRYPTIRGLEASDARTPSDRLAQNLNLDFNVVWLQTIKESIQCMVPKGSPLSTLVQQRAEAAGQVIAAERSASNYRGELSIGKR